MRIALPVIGETFSRHFGQSEGFIVFDVDLEQRCVLRSQRLDADRGGGHGCRGFPSLLKARGVELVIVGGLGAGAKGGLEGRGIDVVVGADVDQPGQIVEAWLGQSLELTGNVCNHADGHEAHGCHEHT